MEEFIEAERKAAAIAVLLGRQSPYQSRVIDLAKLEREEQEKRRRQTDIIHKGPNRHERRRSAAMVR
jgi:hypothetical protein